MFWKAFGLALLVMVAIVGLAGTGVFGFLYAQKDTGPSRSNIEASATAAYAIGRVEGEAAGRASAEKCDVIVGLKVPDSGGRKNGEKANLDLTVRSTKSGNTYEVTAYSGCTLFDDGTCEPDKANAVGSPYPRGCHG